MAGYHAIPNAILHKAIDRGVKPNPTPLAHACGVSPQTMIRVLQGRPCSTSTMAAIERGLDARPGELFEPMPEDPKGSLRVAR
jgi:hypothetical protein